LLPALALATPVGLRARFEMAGLGLAALVAVQALAMVGLVRGYLCLQQTPGSFTCLWLLRLVFVSGQLSAAALWVLLAWRHWLGPTAVRAPRRADESAGADVA
jgi:hypothetical protein